MTRRMVEMWNYAAVLLLQLGVFFSRSHGVKAQQHSNMNLLMVGNSFSEVHNLEEMIQAMLQERKMLLQTDSVFAARFEVGAANMTHYANSEDLGIMIKERPWNWVVLQEQSQIPGFCGDEPKDYLKGFNQSVFSIMQLHDKIQDDGATTILYETWGYFNKDPYNPNKFKDYESMQGWLTKGYQIYYDSIIKKNSKARVKIAPAGLAFERVYRSIERKGQDPLADGSLFDELFMKVDENPTHDGNQARKYPTLEGAYLCACVLFQTISGLDIRQSSYTPPNLDYKMRDVLQKVAYDTMVEFNGGESPTSAYDWATTKPPYKPTYQSSSSSSSYSYSEEESQSSSTGRWLIAIVLMAGGLGSYWVAAKRRSDVTVHIPRDYGWNLVGSDDRTMELSDMPNPDLQRF